MTRRRKLQFASAIIGAFVGVTAAWLALADTSAVTRLTAIGSAFGAGASLVAAVALRRAHRG